ncbi:MAG TPA: helix-turn-helix domain-containing protein [Burkholderiales bacterium]|nr:helix-turn-helix domain-containing protein [Burkholderiales bacterium]
MDKPDNAAGTWVTLADAAAALRVSDRTIRRRMRDGSLPYRKEGARLWIQLADAVRGNVDIGSPGGHAADRAALLADVARLADLVTRLEAERDYLRAALAQALALQQARLGAPRRPWRWPWQRE